MEHLHPTELTIELCPAQKIVHIIETTSFEGRQCTLQFPRGLQKVCLHDKGLKVVRALLEDAVQAGERSTVLTQEPEHVSPMSQELDIIGILAKLGVQ